MELYADYAGEAVARHLSAPARGDLGDPVGRAMLSALLGPGTGHAPDAAVLQGPGDGSRARERRPANQPASLDPTMSRFAGDIVNRLLSICSSLDSARGHRRRQARRRLGSGGDR